MRFEKLLLAAAALCLVCMAPACSDDDPATDPEQNETPGTPGEGEGDGDGDDDSGEPDTPDTPALTEGVRAEGYYKGDYHDEGTGNYWINFTVEDENDPGATISSASISTVRWRPTPISRRWTSETIR